MTRILYILSCAVLLCTASCDKSKGGDSSDSGQKDKEVQELLGKVKAVKTINTFDEEACWYYYINHANNSPQATLKKRVITSNKVEGRGAFVMTYRFSGTSTDGKPETVFFQQKWGDYSSDLSFYPLGLSIWIKGRPDNSGTFRFVLMQDEVLAADNHVVRSTFEYTDPDILKHDGWQRLVIPYSWFKPMEGTTNPLDLSRNIGYRIEIVSDGEATGDNEFIMDNLEQLTSYEPEYTGKPKFSSLFIQLNSVYQNTDWDEAFTACKEVGIDIWIIQYSVGFGVENNVSWYTGSQAEWVTTEYNIIDRMVEAAERCGFKLMFGMFGGDYSKVNTQDQSVYDELLRKNKLVANELYERFGDSPCFDGWYITEEFHDGTYPVGWHAEKARKCLANYLQSLAAYVKTFPNKYPVAIAPALWRGLPADKSGEWFELLFTDTPDIDYLYLQDCAGRCCTDVDVDLANWYSHIKEACDKTGVEFGVDVESFLSCSCPYEPYREKTWEELQEQLFMAGKFTEHITNFSWATFKPGQSGFEGYKAYVNEE